ncbi:MAG: phosphoglycerate kinase [Candidatus Anstonellales archaeon]
MKSVYDVNLRGKVVLKRIDLNSPVSEGKVLPNPRIREHAKSVKELSEMGAKVVLLSHQGSPGEDDFLSLEQHALLLAEEVGKPVKFVPDVCGEKAKGAIRGMKDGEIVLLENVRFVEDETKEEGVNEAKIVKELSPLADYFILDALSVSHRKHASVVGFGEKLPVLAGRTLVKEVEALNKVSGGKDVVFIMGGSKVKDSLRIMKKQMNGKNRFLLGGVIATLFLHAEGNDIGASMSYLITSDLLKHVDEVKEIMAKHRKEIMLPVDVGVKDESGKRKNVKVGEKINGEILDIGPETAKKYAMVIKKAKNIAMNGPMGVYEIPEFSYGTKEVLKAITESKAFSLIGGGHTTNALEALGIDDKKIGYISLSGKAFLKYLGGEELVGVEMLRKHSKTF